MTTGADWGGAVGGVWAREWRRTDRSFAGLSPHLNAAILDAAPAGPARAVDLGCGAGETSVALAGARPDLQVAGVDISPELVRIATERGAGLDNLSFATADVAADAGGVADGAALLLSRHGVMFYDDPTRVFAALRAAAAPGAALVFSCFRAPGENPWASTLTEQMTGAKAVRPTNYAPGPFAFADAGWVTAMLRDGGWSRIEPRAIDYTYLAGEGTDPVADAAAFFSRIGPVSTALRAAPDADRAAMLQRLSRALEEHRTDDRVTFPAAAWIWSARA